MRFPLHIFKLKLFPWNLITDSTQLFISGFDCTKASDALILRSKTKSYAWDGCKIRTEHTISKTFRIPNQWKLKWLLLSLLNSFNTEISLNFGGFMVQSLIVETIQYSRYVDTSTHWCMYVHCTSGAYFVCDVCVVHIAYLCLDANKTKAALVIWMELGNRANIQ